MDAIVFLGWTVKGVLYVGWTLLVFILGMVGLRTRKRTWSNAR